MRAARIIEQLHREPFRPFLIHLSDGSSYEVRHPEMALVTRNTVAVAIDAQGADLPEDMVLCDPLHITKLAPLGNSGKKRRRTRGDN